MDSLALMVAQLNISIWTFVERASQKCLSTGKTGKMEETMAHQVALRGVFVASDKEGGQSRLSGHFTGCRPALSSGRGFLSQDSKPEWMIGGSEESVRTKMKKKNPCTCFGDRFDSWKRSLSTRRTRSAPHERVRAYVGEVNKKKKRAEKFSTVWPW
jgi:hypothetical protein